jgi:ABC-type transporter Mla MlaB component
MGSTLGRGFVLWFQTAFGETARLRMTAPQPGWRRRRDSGPGGELVLLAAPGPGLDADWLSVTLLAGPVGLRLSGEADWHTVGILQRAIAELPPEADEIHLQLASLEFIDVAAARQLVTLTERPAQSRVILHQPPDVLMWLISLLWPDSLIRFFVRGARPGNQASAPGTVRPAGLPGAPSCGPDTSQCHN